MFYDLFNGHICAVCYLILSTEIVNLDKLQDIKSRRQAVLKEK